MIRIRMSGLCCAASMTLPVTWWCNIVNSAQTIKFNSDIFGFSQTIRNRADLDKVSTHRIND